MVQLGRANQGQCEKTGRGVSDNMKIKIWKLIFIIFVIGNFKFAAVAEVGFWNYFRNDKMHNFYPEEEGARFIETPWWLQNENK